MRYVDDTFVLLQDEDQRNDFHKALNDLHPNLKFTSEVEKEDKISFLDVLVEKVDQRFVTSVFRKSTFTGQYVRWNSFCDKRRKTNLVKTLVHRAKTICSEEKLPNELEYIRSMLINNGYPGGMISKIIRIQLSGDKQQEPCC